MKYSLCAKIEANAQNFKDSRQNYFDIRKHFIFIILFYFIFLLLRKCESKSNDIHGNMIDQSDEDMTEKRITSTF